MIKLSLEGKAVPNPTGGAKWDISQIRSILGNEKYCGDVLMQKTFTQDCINKKVIKSTGQLPMYLIQNIIRQSSAGKYIRRFRQKRSGDRHRPAHQKRRPPQAVPVMPASLPYPSDWCAGSAAPCIKVYMEAERKGKGRLALRETIGLRNKILPPVTNYG